MNKLKKIAIKVNILNWFLSSIPNYVQDRELYVMYLIQVIAESLSEEEIAGLKEMFKMIDTDNSGHITLEELKKGLDRVGADLKDSEILGLMQAVSPFLY